MRPDIRTTRTCLLAIALLATTAIGCRSARQGLFRAPGPVAPVVLQQAPQAPQIVAAVNANTSRVRTYYTTSARFTVPGMAGLPLLRGTIALERPNNFRLQAGIALTGGDEIDLGSNSELLWFWVKRNTPPALYYCRHDQFATSGARQVLPIDPTWIGDALGLVQLNPDAPYEGPVDRGDGTLELRAPITTPTGPMTRVLVIDATRAWVLEQHLYDGGGGPPVASAVAEDFRYDEAAQVSLPRQVTIRVPASDLALTVETGAVVVNGAIPNATLMFSPPALESYPRVDLGSTAPGLAFDKRAIQSPIVVPPVTASQPVLPPPTVQVSSPPVAATPYASAAVPATQGLPAGGIALDPRPHAQ